ncbi:40S ribosomal protein S5-1 [Hordeum vulgare]|nr:40S ribosomal protein S5-1 [Hordeum vulgare]
MPKNSVDWDAMPLAEFQLRRKVNPYTSNRVQFPRGDIFWTNDQFLIYEDVLKLKKNLYVPVQWIDINHPKKDPAYFGDALSMVEQLQIEKLITFQQDFDYEVINPYLTEVLQHPQSIKMSEEMLHIRDVEGPKKTGSVETRLEAMEQQVFKCQGMMERGLNANNMMITEFTNNHKMDAIDIGKHLSRLYDRVDQLQGQIYDL